MVENWSKMVKNDKKRKKVFSNKDFWIGRDPPPLLTESKKTVLYASPYSVFWTSCTDVFVSSLSRHRGLFGLPTLLIAIQVK